jgi:hypothetical protein
MPLITRGMLPLLLKVAVWGVLVAPETMEKLSVLSEPEPDEAGASTAAGAVPVPLRDTVCGELEALSAMVSVAPKVPADAGVKATEIEQLLPAASEPPQLLVWLKSVAFAPVIPMPLIWSGVMPMTLLTIITAGTSLELVKVTVCVALVVPVAAEKLSEADVSVTVGATEKLAVTLCGAFMVTVVAALPALATLPVQLANV